MIGEVVVSLAIVQGERNGKADATGRLGIYIPYKGFVSVEVKRQSLQSVKLRNGVLCDLCCKSGEWVTVELWGKLESHPFMCTAIVTSLLA